MKIALAIAVLVLAFQQQTFSSTSAKPKPVPAHTAQPLPAGFIYNGYNGSSGREHQGHGGKYRVGKPGAKSTGSTVVHKQSATHPAPAHT